MDFVMKRLEDNLQIAAVRWFRYQFPDVVIFAIPNGGKRHIGTAVKMKAEGVRAGVPDVCLPVARGGYHGLYIEMKDGKKRPSEAQMWWLAMLENEGYRAEVAHSCDDAQAVILDYLSLPDVEIIETLEAENTQIRGERLNMQIRLESRIDTMRAEKSELLAETAALRAELDAEVTESTVNGIALQYVKEDYEELRTENAALRARLATRSDALLVDTEGR